MLSAAARIDSVALSVSETTASSSSVALNSDCPLGPLDESAPISARV